MAILSVPNMVMIGGNSRNAGKTTLACNIIRKLAVHHKVIALKVTSIRPGEADLHGTHSETPFTGYSILEETNSGSAKDTSLMLQAGAKHVFYVRASEGYVEEAIADFLSKYNHQQPIVCESRSLREIVTPGLFLMMMRIPPQGVGKDVTNYISLADKILTFSDDRSDSVMFVSHLDYNNGSFTWK